MFFYLLYKMAEITFCLTDENVIGKGFLKRDVIYKMVIFDCTGVCDRNKSATFKRQLSLSENSFRIFC
jgi:hypothetical protein